MPSNFGLSQVVDAYVRVTGGEVGVASSLVPKIGPLALKEPERDPKKTKNIKHEGNISLNDMIEIAKVMKSRSMAKDLTGTIKEILWTCVSVGCTVDENSPKDLQQNISDGDIEIPLD
ncbi:hypothetical protein CsSME_00038336 [Camellia sinensis var. sinensis]